MQKRILVGLALLVVGLLGVSVTVLAVNAQSNNQNSMMSGGIGHNNMMNNYGSGGHMGGMAGTSMMQAYGNFTMQNAGNCGGATATP